MDETLNINPKDIHVVRDTGKLLKSIPANIAKKIVTGLENLEHDFDNADRLIKEGSSIRKEKIKLWFRSKYESIQEKYAKIISCSKRQSEKIRNRAQEKEEENKREYAEEINNIKEETKAETNDLFSSNSLDREIANLKMQYDEEVKKPSPNPETLKNLYEEILNKEIQSTRNRKEQYENIIKHQQVKEEEAKNTYENKNETLEKETKEELKKDAASNDFTHVPLNDKYKGISLDSLKNAFEDLEVISLNGKLEVRTKNTNELIQDKNILTKMQFAYSWINACKSVENAFTEDAKKMYSMISVISLSQVNNNKEIDPDKIVSLIANSGRTGEIPTELLNSPEKLELYTKFINDNNVIERVKEKEEVVEETEEEVIDNPKERYEKEVEAAKLSNDVDKQKYYENLQEKAKEEPQKEETKEPKQVEPKLNIKEPQKVSEQSKVAENVPSGITITITNNAKEIRIGNDVISSLTSDINNKVANGELSIDQARGLLEMYRDTIINNPTKEETNEESLHM